MGAADNTRAIGAVEGWVKNGNGAPYSIPGVYNFDPRNYANLRAGLAKMRAGTANLKIAYVGDSTTYGEGGTGNGIVGCVAKAPPAFLASILTSMGLPASANAWFGEGGNSSIASLVSADPRLAIDAGWGLTGTFYVPGGLMLRNPQTDTTSKIAFTPTSNVNQFDVYYPTNSGLGTISVDIDGGTATLQSLSSAGGVGKVSVTAGAVGSHTVNVKRSSGGDAYCIGVSAYDNTSKRVEVWPMGRRGSKTTDWNDTTNPWSPQTALASSTFAPHLALIQLGINDRNASTDPSGAVTALTAFIAALQANKTDVWLLNPHPTDPVSYATQATQNAYTSAFKALALAKGCPFIDFAYPDQTYTIANGLGLMYDGLHRSGAGYADQARIVGQLLLSL